MQTYGHRTQVKGSKNQLWVFLRFLFLKIFKIKSDRNQAARYTIYKSDNRLFLPQCVFVFVSVISGGDGLGGLKAMLLNILL